MVKIKFLKKILTALFLVVLFNFLEYGFVWNRIDQFVYPIILMIITLTVYYILSLRKIFFFFSFVLLLFMVLLYLLNELNLANIVGSFGFSLLLITLSTYLPQIIKRGFIEKF